eukprot:snap_masked-scaffold_1-processed-gene-18.23-mRNA-1 protein AED:1.00 eAED:1.00 QI:0/0/0/0/1/1/2/0/74
MREFLFVILLKKIAKSSKNLGYNDLKRQYLCLLTFDITCLQSAQKISVSFQKSLKYLIENKKKPIIRAERLFIV